LVRWVVFGGLNWRCAWVAYGYPTSFFLRPGLMGHDFYVPNAKFTFRFFSARLARPSLPIRMAADKPAGTYSGFLIRRVGGERRPGRHYGFGAIPRGVTPRRFPKTIFEVLCVAITGINSHRSSHCARGVRGIRAILWLF